MLRGDVQGPVQCPHSDGAFSEGRGELHPTAEGRPEQRGIHISCHGPHKLHTPVSSREALETSVMHATYAVHHTPHSTTPPHTHHTPHTTTTHHTHHPPHTTPPTPHTPHHHPSHDSSAYNVPNNVRTYVRTYAPGAVLAVISCTQRLITT